MTVLGRFVHIFCSALKFNTSKDLFLKEFQIVVFEDPVSVSAKHAIYTTAIFKGVDIAFLFLCTPATYNIY